MLFFLQLFGLKAGILAGGLTLVIMILPTIVRTTQESLKTVPQSYREGSLALGAGKWHMVRTVVLPNAVDGIVTGCILAIGRIVGESAALLFTAGFGLALNDFITSLQSSSATLTVALYVYASERGEMDVAFAIAGADDPGAHHQLRRLPGRQETEKKGPLIMADDIITVKSLNLWYGTDGKTSAANRGHHALKDINVDIPVHQITALIGPSGCGKSTFLKTLNRMNDLVPGVHIEGDVCQSLPYEHL